MLAKKNRGGWLAPAMLAMVGFLTACTPAGPRALLKGRSLLEAGETDAAVARLEMAVALMPTNAAAWNYLGVALHRSGQWTNAVEAYSRAIVLDRELVEARFNLGCLYFDQNQMEAAKAELTAYTLRRENSLAGWLKLGAVQLRGRETSAAEKSYRQALRINTTNAEALNGLGLVLLQRNRAREAADLFTDALKQQPDYRPALLNLAAVSHQQLNDRAEALRRYREYLELQPRPEDWEAVNAIVQSLASPAGTAAEAARPRTNGVATVRSNGTPVVTARTNQARSTPGVAARTAAVTRPVSNGAAPPAVTPKPASTPTPVQPKPTPAPPVEVVRLPPEPVIKPASEPTRSVETSSPPATTPTITSPASAPARPTESGLRPGRYVYLSPRTPPPGNRREAERAFAQGQNFQRAGRLSEALQSFRRATLLDPAYFEAYYNVGLVAFSARSFGVALSAWEHALALRLDNADVRYNFALTLKAANYPQDAVNELEKLVSLHPDEARGHLTLGNLYAEQLRDVPRARRHYQRVLQLDPSNPQGQAIRYWLMANPE